MEVVYIDDNQIHQDRITTFRKLLNKLKNESVIDSYFVCPTCKECKFNRNDRNYQQCITNLLNNNDFNFGIIHREGINGESMYNILNNINRNFPFIYFTGGSENIIESYIKQNLLAKFGNNVFILSNVKDNEIEEWPLEKFINSLKQMKQGEKPDWSLWKKVNPINFLYQFANLFLPLDIYLKVENFEKASKYYNNNIKNKLKSMIEDINYLEYFDNQEKNELIQKFNTLNLENLNSNNDSIKEFYKIFDEITYTFEKKLKDKELKKKLISQKLSEYYHDYFTNCFFPFRESIKSIKQEDLKELIEAYKEDINEAANKFEEISEFSKLCGLETIKEYESGVNEIKTYLQELNNFITNLSNTNTINENEKQKIVEKINEFDKIFNRIRKI